jgi:16S rRNA (guanine1516-N2)-methyltransferase
MFILYENKELRGHAIQLGSELQLPVYSSRQEIPSSHKLPQDFCLVLTNEKLELQQSDNKINPFFIDFNDEDLQYRIRHSTRKNEALARAVGLKKNKKPLVFDLTAGIGRDAFILAKLGCSLHLFEKNKIIAALLRDGIIRASKGNLSETIGKMTLHPGDALEILPKIAAHSPPDVLYLDPMFPHRAKSALVKKEMRILRSVVGDDTDSSQLFIEAQKYAGDRVVCKRPRQAPFINDTSPSMSIKTKKHRFDVYLQVDKD